MNSKPERYPDPVDEPTRSHVPAAETPTADWRPSEETTNEALAESALGAQLDRLLDGLETGQRLGQSGSADIEQLRPVIEELHALAGYLGPARREPGSPESVQRAREEQLTGLTEGQCVGKYQIVRQLGGGGQAAAHLAFDPDLRRHVVLKLYHEARTAAEQEAVLQEGRALARVRSRYVAQVHAADRNQGVPYLVVEYIPGRNLTEAQRAKPLTLDRALEVVGQLGEGLAAVHACGLLHRDLKPSNIMLGDDGVPRLVDFGLATHVGGEGLRRVSGTLAYMAPEQARGESERIDPRSDIFGLGAVLYMLLTDTPPHQAGSRQALWDAAKQCDIVPPRQRAGAVPEAVSDLCMRCLAKDPSQRFNSATELVEAIQCARHVDQGLLAGLDRRFGRRSVRATLVAAAVILVATPLALFAVFGRGGAPPSSSVLGGDPGLPAATSPEATSLVASLHPDGRTLRQDFPISVEIVGGTIDGSGRLNLVSGEKLAFRVQPSQDCYLAICYVDHEQRVFTLFPSENEPDNLVSKDRPRVVPGEKKGTITATPSEGPEYIYVLASTRPWKAPEGQKLRTDDGNVLSAFVTKEERKVFEDTTRGLVYEKESRPEKDKAPAVTERVIPFQVKAANP